jgi:lipid A 3-O-deacylase
MYRRLFYCKECIGGEWSGNLRRTIGWLVLAISLAGVEYHAAGAQAVASVTNPVRDTDRSFNVGVLTQGGFGVTEDRSSFHFFMVGARAGKVLTPTEGKGLLRGNFEYGVEVFPFWQSYTPTMYRQNCVYVAAPVLVGGQEASCSVPFKVGGTYTGVSVTPIILRWNFAGYRRWSPWVQGAGGLLWTNHKYPAFGGPPLNNGGLSYSTLGDNAANDDTSVWNFTPQFGVGAHYFINARRSIDFGANAIHISSASLGDKNPGVNASVQFTVGMSWWK